MADPPAATKQDNDARPRPPLVAPASTHTNARGISYFLHAKDVRLRNGRPHRLYYFARTPNTRDTVLTTLPDGFRAVENHRTGIPYLRPIQPRAGT